MIVPVYVAAPIYCRLFSAEPLQRHRWCIQVEVQLWCAENICCKARSWQGGLIVEVHRTVANYLRRKIGLCAVSERILSCLTDSVLNFVSVVRKISLTFVHVCQLWLLRRFPKPATTFMCKNRPSLLITWSSFWMIKLVFIVKFYRYTLMIFFHFGHLLPTYFIDLILKILKL